MINWAFQTNGSGLVGPFGLLLFGVGKRLFNSQWAHEV